MQPPLDELRRLLAAGQAREDALRDAVARGEQSMREGGPPIDLESERLRLYAVRTTRRRAGEVLAAGGDPQLARRVVAEIDALLPGLRRRGAEGAPGDNLANPGGQVVP